MAMIYQISVAENCLDEWESYTTKLYIYNLEKKKELLDSFETLADDRNDCYVFHCSCHGDGNDKIQYTAEDYDYLDYGESYCAISSEFREGMNVGLRYETTAYFMQYLAYLSAKDSQGGKVPFLPASWSGAGAFMKKVSSKYKDTKGVI